MSSMLIFAALLALYVAWNVGANDVANSMGTVVGAKSLTLRQALIVAGVLEFVGAVLLGHNVSQNLVSNTIDAEPFADAPHTLLLGMVAVLIAVGLWLNLATLLGLPVSTSHAVVGAIAGFGWAANGVSAIAWGTLAKLSLTWVATPIVSAIAAALLYGLIQRSILNRPQPLIHLNEWIPWLSALVFGIFGSIALPAVAAPPGLISSDIPHHTLELAIAFMATLSLTWVCWQRLHPKRPDAATPVRPSVEAIFAQLQIVSACFVAFAHGSNDVGNAIAPFAVVETILKTGISPLTTLSVPLWSLILGGAGIVAGLAVMGRKVIIRIGEDITQLKPSSGFSAELATASTVLLASRLGLPVSTSHALVGAVVGVGLVQGNQAVSSSSVRAIALAWFATIPLTGLISAGVFKGIAVLFPA
jgi:inorganic phosphate transporter, PiT family